MDFYTDGSKITKPYPAIGWGAVCDSGVVVANGCLGGTNINAEIFAIRDLLNSLLKYKHRLVEDDATISIITDSLTSIQIINGCLVAPNEYNESESVNYKAAHKICDAINAFKQKGKEVKFIHIRGHRDNLGNNFADYVATQQSFVKANEVSIV